MELLFSGPAHIITPRQNQLSDETDDHFEMRCFGLNPRLTNKIQLLNILSNFHLFRLSAHFLVVLAQQNIFYYWSTYDHCVTFNF